MDAKCICISWLCIHIYKLICFHACAHIYVDTHVCMCSNVYRYNCMCKYVPVYCVCKGMGTHMCVNACFCLGEQEKKENLLVLL